MIGPLVITTLALALQPQSKQVVLTVAGKGVEVSISPVSDHVARIAVSPIDQAGSPQPLEDEPVLVKRAWPPPVLRVRSVSPPVKTRAGNMTLAITSAGDALNIVAQAADGRPIQNIRIDRESGALSFAVGTEPVFGLGQGGPQFDRRGQAYPPTHDHEGYKLPLYGGRLPIPWLMSASGWAMFLHRPLGRIDLTGTEGRITPEAGQPLPIDLFVVSGSPAELISEYAALTGVPSMPPLWAFGYVQSHRTLRDFAEVLWVAKTFREKKLPCDTLIYLGTGWCPSGWNTGHDSYDFNPKVFSDPEAQLRQLRDLNFRVILHSTYPPENLYGSVNDRSVPPEDKSGVVHYWSRHQPVSRLGIDGWWPDAGEELGPESRLARIRMYWDGPQLDHPNQRPFALHRTGYAGMQRFGGWLWSGDVNSLWETLRNHVPIAINTGLSGVPYWGTDIGGFYPTPEYKGELYVRWFQFGAFCPLFRSHGRTWYSHLPYGWNTGVLGPDEMEQSRAGKTPLTAEDMRNPQVEPICRKYLELRYRMLPYIYSAAEEAHRTGIPMMRALWLHYPDDPRAVERGDEYLWGRDMLVAPVVEPGATSRSLYLPRGAWYDFWTEAGIEGGRPITREVNLDTTPLYVRAGALIPIGPLKEYTAQKTDGSLTLTVYTGADGAFDLYEDDGVTFNADKGERMRAQFRWNDRERRLTLNLGAYSKMMPPLERKIDIRLVPGHQRKQMVFRGKSNSVQF